MIRLVHLGWGNYSELSGWAQYNDRVLIKGRCRIRVRERRCKDRIRGQGKDAMLLDLNMEEGAMGQGTQVQAFLEAGKGKEVDSRASRRKMGLPRS